MNKKDKQKPFSSDCFGRKEFADNLLKLIKNQVDYESRVIAIKADFGLGKTFFAKEFEKFMREHLENAQDSPKIYPHYVNIWKENYTNEPLLALLYELEKIANKYQGKTIARIVKCCAYISVPFAKLICNILAKIINCQIFLNDFWVFIDEAKNNLTKIKTNDKFDNIKSYEKITQNIIKAFESHKDKKFVIIIDEIDRCMPEYAIRFLETLKHFFDIQGLYFILMFNEYHLQKSLHDRFDYIDFALWKDKFIDLEFDLSVSHNQKNFIKYLVDKKDNFKNIEMYVTYNIINAITFDSQHLFGGNWDTYIDSFLNSLNVTLNNRQLSMLFLRLDIALGILANEIVMPDCLMCVILKDMFDSSKLTIKKGYDDIPFTYYDENTQSREHIIKLFCGGSAYVSHLHPINVSTFLGHNNHGYSNNNIITTLNNQSHHNGGNILQHNKRVAEFAILVK